MGTATEFSRADLCGPGDGLCNQSKNVFSVTHHARRSPARRVGPEQLRPSYLISIFPPGGPIPRPPLLPIRSIGGPPRPAPRKPPLSMPPRPLKPPRSPAQPPRKPPGPPGPPAPAGPPRSIPLPPRIPIPPRPRSPTGNGGPPPSPSGLGALHWLHSSRQLKFWLPQPLEREQLRLSTNTIPRDQAAPPRPTYGLGHSQSPALCCMLPPAGPPLPIPRGPPRGTNPPRSFPRPIIPGTKTSHV